MIGELVELYFHEPLTFQARSVFEMAVLRALLRGLASAANAVGHHVMGLLHFSVVDNCS